MPRYAGALIDSLPGLWHGGFCVAAAYLLSKHSFLRNSAN
jgi:hypothetical protein